MNMCVQFVKKSLINLSRLNAKPPTYFVQVAFHLPLKCVDLYAQFATIQPAPFVLRTILSELDLQCPTCTHTVKLHQLPQHEENCTPNPMRAPPDNATPIPGVVPGTPPSSVLETPVPTAAVRRKALVQTPPPQEQLEVPGVATVSTATVYEAQRTVKQLLQSPKEVYTSLKEEVGLFIIRQFLSQSQDGATILLKTGGQVNNII